MKQNFFLWVLWISLCFFILIDIANGAKNKKGKKDDSSAKSCKEAQDGDSSGKPTQTIHPGVGKKSGVEVRCDFETDGGGWTIIQKRDSGPIDEFDRTWAEYAYGFGHHEGNYWIGLDKIYAMTRKGDHELRIDLEDFDGGKAYAKYSSFSVSDEKGFFKLKVSGYDAKSTAGDSLSGGNGMKFSADEKDNDESKDKNCAEKSGGWWFNACGQANLNGPYKKKKDKIANLEGIVWGTWKGESTPLAKTEMKIRPRSKK